MSWGTSRRSYWVESLSIDDSRGDRWVGLTMWANEASTVSNAKCRSEQRPDRSFRAVECDARGKVVAVLWPASEAAQ